jgi:hypothetical protein
MLNATPKKRVGLVIASDSELPAASNGLVGCDW